MENFCNTYCVAIVSSVLIILVLYAILDYSGMFYKIVVGTRKNPVGPLRVAYLYGTGAYKNCGPLFGRVAELAPHDRCIGIFYDDPKTIPESKLRYIVGTVLSENNEPVGDEVMERVDEAGFRVAEFPAIETAVVTDFPSPWMLSLFFVIWRVYPKLSEFIKRRELDARPTIEIYDGPKCYFYMPLSNHDAYYVPEACK